ncbi:hypothetical protein SDC9_120862 [bioreactor metagenome]|uniref:Uncharacterized protein n=1 Tax=bioreactor metagenome TaxID=1076179 RepID=A0A645CAC0_9ZZZZ
MGQPHTLKVSGNFIDLRAERIPINRDRGEPLQILQQLFHPVQFQRRAKDAGEQLSLPHQRRNGLVLQPAGGQILLHSLLAAKGNLLSPLRLGPGKIHAAAVQAALQLRQQRGPVGPRLVHLVDKQECGYAAPLQQPPERQGVALNAVRSADHQNRAVQHLKRPLRLGGKIRMTGGIQQRQLQTVQRQHRLL